MMQEELIAIAGEIVSKATRERPADAVLRADLRNRSGLVPSSSRFISEAVFAYFRWCRWFNPDTQLSQQIRQALDLQNRFDSAPESFPADELLQKAIPDWAREHVAISIAWVRALQQKPVLWLRSRMGSAAEVAASLDDCHTVEGFPTALIYNGRADLFRSAQFHSGLFELQDLGSQIVGHLCAPQPIETWWDACAGEGGKTLHLSDLMQNKGLIWASDRAEWRLKNLKRRAARAKAFNYRTASWNGGLKLPTKTKFDGVLIDAPCTGVGTWGRNPHARWTTDAADALELQRTQLELIRNAAPAVKPGGKLIYAVCSLTRAETTDVTSQITNGLQGFSPIQFRHPINGEAVSEVWLWPQDYGGNGMFIAGWRRA